MGDGLAGLVTGLPFWLYHAVTPANPSKINWKFKEVKLFFVGWSHHHVQHDKPASILLVWVGYAGVEAGIWLAKPIKMTKLIKPVKPSNSY